MLEGEVSRRRSAEYLLAAAQCGHAAWLFGNLYEAVVRIPDRLAAPPPQRRTARTVSPLGPGSPVRYHALAGAGSVPPLLAAAAIGWRSPGRRWLAASAASSISAAAATAYLVRTVNLRLFFDAPPVSTDEREILLRRWYRINTLRIGLTGTAWLASTLARNRVGSHSAQHRARGTGLNVTRAGTGRTGAGRPAPVRDR